MLIRRTVVAAALVAFPLALAAPAQATCSDGYFGASPDKSICGVPNIQTSVGNAKNNLRENFNVGNAERNFQHALTQGVGETDKNAP